MLQLLLGQVFLLAVYQVVRLSLLVAVMQAAVVALTAAVKQDLKEY